MDENWLAETNLRAVRTFAVEQGVRGGDPMSVAGRIVAFIDGLPASEPEDWLAEHIHAVRSSDWPDGQKSGPRFIGACEWDFDSVVDGPLTTWEKPGDPLCWCRAIAQRIIGGG
jgi:hypothetical protein